jgi:sterol desaturase/sphingolipid hydroxylase (fatty acid hydroxylase superfamily)
MWVRPAARHHLMHHAQDSGRFNVFLPIFDWLAGLFQPRARTSAREAGR